MKVQAAKKIESLDLVEVQKLVGHELLNIVK